MSSGGGERDSVEFLTEFDLDAWMAGKLIAERITEVPAQSVQLLPVFSGRRVFAFAENYREPGAIAGRVRRPMLFFKPDWCVVAEDEPVHVSDLLHQGARIWGESELAVVIGPDARPQGVTLANDVTMEMPEYDDQDHHLPFMKGHPGFCPCSSLLLPLSSLDRYQIEGFHNGELLRSGTEREQIFRWDELWEWLTAWARPAPGDIILIGAPRRIRPRDYVGADTVFRSVLNNEFVLETRFV